MTPNPKVAKAAKVVPGGKGAKTSNARSSYTPNDNINFVSEVSGECPKCGRKLLKERGKKTTKDYELAHIFPLNPSNDEIALLAKEERLSVDPNNENNIIALCIFCHHELDNPRTLKDYRELLELKKDIILFNKEKIEWEKHSLSDSITSIIHDLLKFEGPEADAKIEFNPKTIDEKTKPDIASINRSRIKHDVELYYSKIKKDLAEEEKISPGIATYISLQIKTYYKSLEMRKIPKPKIYKNITSWIQKKTTCTSVEACQIITSFFVQNCEIFEVKE